MDPAEPGRPDLLRSRAPDLGVVAPTVGSSTHRRDSTRPTEVRPSEALRAKLGRLNELRDRGLLSSDELTVATARLLGL